MVEILAHRGPDGAGVWNRGSVGLGHRMLWTTPESLREKLPLLNSAGDLIITADARIDNRDELIETLELTDRPSGEITDSQLILAAYAKWGDLCPEKLLGDFAFAIWDSRKQSLFCVRDHFGVKPFYYYLSDRVFVFASEIKALLCLSEVPRRLNEAKVAEYLSSIIDNTTSTFYRHILRLPPAHTVMVNDKGAQLQSYWSLDPSYELRMGSNEEYAEGFRELFTEAVRSRLRSAFPVGSMLSGGLDSSSITCVASNLFAQEGKGRLQTFSGIFDKVTQCDERHFINAVLAQDCLKSYFVQGDQMGPLTDLDRMLWHQDEPFYAPHLFMQWKLNRTINKQGIRVILDGFDGDTTVSHGLGYLHELAAAGRWFSLALAVKGLAGTMGISAPNYLWAYARHYGLDPMISQSKILKLVRRAGRALIRRVRRGHIRSAGPPPWAAILNPEFVDRTALVKRYEAWRQTLPVSARNGREEHYRDITQGLKSYALEVLDKVSAAFSVETRYPFWDRRLVEFCLALPSDQKLYRGWSRMVLRRAMADILPSKVQWRRDKTDFTANFFHGLLSFERERLDEVILDNTGVVAEYLDINMLHETYHRLVAQEYQSTLQKVEDARSIWKVVSLNLWLQNMGISSSKSTETNKNPKEILMPASCSG